MQNTNLSISEAINLLEQHDFKVKFEGGIILKMPHISISDIENDNITKKKQDKLGLLRKEIAYLQRPEKEKLLRLIIFELFHSGYLDKNKSIIDIGCWIADNAIPWSLLINKNSVVHAIDPSEENLNFGKNIANLNNCKNINWVKAVCSEEVGEHLSFKGNIEHANFKNANNKQETTHISNNLDNIINCSQYKSISLIHADVEGFEEKTLRGAKNIIEKEKPVILFEQHISSDKTKDLIEYLKDFDYDTFMINEILPGCQPDCRNFISFDNKKGVPKLPKIINSQGRQMNIFFACLGEALIPVN